MPSGPKHLRAYYSTRITTQEKYKSTQGEFWRLASKMNLRSDNHDGDESSWVGTTYAKAPNSRLTHVDVMTAAP
jgi:hypothetical protein